MSEEGGTSWKNAFSVEYRKINPECTYCGKDVTVVRIANMVGDTAAVSTLCTRCADGEIRSIVEEEGFRSLPNRSSFFNMKLFDEVSDEQVKMIAKIFGLELFIAEEKDGNGDA